MATITDICAGLQKSWRRAQADPKTHSERLAGTFEAARSTAASEAAKSLYARLGDPSDTDAIMARASRLAAMMIAQGHALAVGPDVIKRRGRPKVGIYFDNRESFLAKHAAADRAIRNRTGKRPTDSAMAVEMGCSKSTLQRERKRWIF